MLNVGLLPLIGYGALGILTFVLTVFFIYSRLYRKVGPNEVLVISGGKGETITEETGERRRLGFRIVKGGGSLINPVTERCEIMSLELITLDIVTPEMYTKMGVPIKVDGVAQIKVRGDDISIRTAAEQFLNKSRDEIKQIAYQTVAGHLRAILGTLTVEEVYAAHDTFAQRVAEVSAGDLSNMGLEVVSFTIREISDSRGYLEAIGKTRIAQVKRDAQIGEAEAFVRRLAGPGGEAGECARLRLGGVVSLSLRPEQGIGTHGAPAAPQPLPQGRRSHCRARAGGDGDRLVPRDDGDGRRGEAGRGAARPLRRRLHAERRGGRRARDAG